MFSISENIYNKELNYFSQVEEKITIIGTLIYSISNSINIFSKK
jgi:hypothetical protein